MIELGSIPGLTKMTDARQTFYPRVPVFARGTGPRRRGQVGMATFPNYGLGPVGMRKRRIGPADLYRRRVRRRDDNLSTNYQYTRDTRTSGTFKPKALLNEALLKAGQEATLYTWRRLKIFDNDGSLKMERDLYTIPGGTAASLPVYAFSLNGINRSSLEHWPMYRLYTWADGADDGKLFFRAVGGDNPTGATSENQLQRMFEGTESSAVTMNGQKAVLRYVDLQMNLWGATGKTTRWTVQVVQVTDEECDPWKLSLNRGTGQTAVFGDAGQQAWQELVKQYTFNPIAKIDIQQARKIKVLKTYDITLQPNSTTDGDPDPQCRVLKWFMKEDRIVRFDDKVEQLAAPFQDDLQYMNNDQRPEHNQVPAGVTPRTKDHLMLLIRASNYKAAYGSYSNGNDGSFDIDYKAKWVHLD